MCLWVFCRRIRSVKHSIHFVFQMLSKHPCQWCLCNHHSNGAVVSAWTKVFVLPYALLCKVIDNRHVWKKSTRWCHSAPRACGETHSFVMKHSSHTAAYDVLEELQSLRQDVRGDTIAKKQRVHSEAKIWQVITIYSKPSYTPSSCITIGNKV